MFLGKYSGCFFPTGFLTISLLFITHCWLPAQQIPIESRIEAPYRARQFTLQHGLPDNFVNALLQDRYGFIWIGTHDGLSRFDGIQFKTFRHQPGDPSSISNNKINALLEDRQGHIWAATDGGLNRYDPATETFRHFRHDPDDARSISHDYIRAVFEDEAGGIWVGAFNGLNRFDPQDNSFTTYLHQESYVLRWLAQPVQEVSAIGETNEGQLLVGYWGMGLMTFDKTSGDFQVVPSSDSSITHKDLTVDKITRARDGGIWICAAGKLFQYAAGKGLKHSRMANTSNVATFSPASSGRYLAGGDGFSILDGDGKLLQRFVPEASPVDPNQNWVVAAMEDRAGDIWFGAVGGGLFHLAAESKSFVHYRQQQDEPIGLHDNFINALAEVEEDLVWVGSRRQGIRVFDRKQNAFTPLPNYLDFPNGLKTKEISVLYQDRDQNIWIGTWGAGLHLYRSLERTFQYFRLDHSDTTSLSDNFVTDVLQTAEGEIWVGTTLGLAVLCTDEDVKRGRFKQYRYNPAVPGSLNHFRVTCIHQTRSGQIWVGAIDGLHRFDQQKESFTLYRQEADKPGTLSNNTIKCIFEDSKGRLWVGTAGGLNLLDTAQGTFRHFPGMDELADGNIAGIQEDEKGALWVAAKKGIAKLDPDEMTYKFYDRRDGLDNHSFNPKAFFRSSHSGMIYAGGRNGMSVFDPGSIRDNPFAPPVWITGLRKYASRKGKPTETIVSGMTSRTKIELAHWENIMAFELTSLNFRNPEKNQFAYRLVGFNDNWIYIGAQRELTFTNLDAGAYTLQVKAGNNDGVWNETPTELDIVVHPPWWKTWWANALYGFFLFTVFYLLRRYELNRQRLAFNLDAEKAEAARLMDLDAFKTRLYINLTHEFRTPLTVILGLADQIDQPSGIREVLRRNAKGLLRLVNQILDLAKLEAGQLKLDLALMDIVPYMQYLTESYQSYAAGKQINLVAYMETERLLMDIDEEKLHSVIANLLSNAIKFTPQGGKVILHLREEGDTLLLKVRDNGIGISARQLPRIFDRFYQVDGTATRAAEGTGLGLALTKELVELMGGQISVSSQEGKGTEFTVALPITRQAPPAPGHSAGPSVPAPLPARSMAQSVQRPENGRSGLPQLLLIEDNEDVAFYIQSCLEGRFALTLAPNGALGIAEALESIPDLIVSDVMMPEKDGFEVCDTLKHDERTSHIPIILLTAKADAASKISGLRRGADAYLTKPFDKEELLVRLEMLLERQKRMAAYFAQPGAAGLPVDEPALEAPLAPEIIAVEDAFLQKVRAIVEEHYADEDFALPQLCQKVGMSRSQLFRKMKALIDESPSDFIRNYRLNEAKRLLETTDLNISEVAWAVGYKDVSHFSKSFQEAFGMLPSATSK